MKYTKNVTNKHTHFQGKMLNHTKINSHHLKILSSLKKITLLYGVGRTPHGVGRTHAKVSDVHINVETDNIFIS